MEQNTRSQGVTFADILRMFRGKVVLIVCLTLIAALLGGAFSVVSSALFKDYGTSVEFYVAPVDNSHTLLPILQSEAFAEKLLLEENGLPKKEQCDPKDYEAALAAIEATNKAREEKYLAQKAVDIIPFELASIIEQYTYYQNAYLQVSELLAIYKGTPSDQIAQGENHAEKIKEYEAALAKITVEKETYYRETYAPKMSEKFAAEEALAKATEDLKIKWAEEEELVEKVLSAWRKQESVINSLNKIHNGVSFSYAMRDVHSGSSTSQVENYNFIVVSVQIPNDEEFVADLLDKIKAVTPEYIEKNLEKLSGKVDVECSLMSTFSGVDNLNDGWAKEAITYAIVAGIAVFALLCIVVIGKNLVKMLLSTNDTKSAEVPAKEEEPTNV